MMRKYKYRHPVDRMATAPPIYDVHTPDYLL